MACGDASRRHHRATDQLERAGRTGSRRLRAEGLEPAQGEVADLTISLAGSVRSAASESGYPGRPCRVPELCGCACRSALASSTSTTRPQGRRWNHNIAHELGHIVFGHQARRRPWQPSLTSKVTGPRSASRPGWVTTRPDGARRRSGS
ncbi:hypothetical protein HBB16_04310 [Pseudonocardia sp. MCCB 268]|nr:hypothetical protein [Pseudonocardia cytotoxica]